jgi:Fe-Mn family superoxide dismutase
MTQRPAELRTGRLYDALGEGFGGFENWKRDFMAVAGMRGIGWAIAYYDVADRSIRNLWIDEHQNGHVAGALPLVVLDVWEHAFIKDYKPADKAKYVEAFFANVDWAACDARLPR